jgi:hypothetical protein
MAHKFQLLLEDGTLADPEIFATGIPSWRPGEVLIITPRRRFRILEVREAATDAFSGVWVVEPVEPPG